MKSFAERFSRAIAEAEPAMFTANIRKVQRKGRIFLDWLEPARRDGGHALLRPCPRRRAGRRRRSPGKNSTATTAATTSASATPTSCSSAPRRRCLQAGARRSKHCRMRKTAPPLSSRSLFLLTAAACPSRPRPARLEGAGARVTIIRDDWGIAHVHGTTDADAVFGMIYAQAEDDFPRIEANYLTNLGRTAEAEGEKAIWQDLRARLYVSDTSSRRITGAARHRCGG